MSQVLEKLDIEALSGPERLELIGLLWDSMIDAGMEIPIPQWHIQELERRRAKTDAYPQESRPWEEVKARLMATK